MTPTQTNIITTFIKETFDARVALAEKDTTFNGLDTKEKNRRVKAWAQMYGKMAYGLLEPKPVFSAGIRDVMRLFKCSQYYSVEFQEVTAPNRERNN